jgi:hypothetical protein
MLAAKPKTGNFISASLQRFLLHGFGAPLFLITHKFFQGGNIIYCIEKKHFFILRSP